ncbi:glucose-6-phosphatase catalytic subunit 1 [Chrysoperla carnea]|uniref:glucose-6-phosphatase catalytic subunit 1 n=1 Tax=Chrysoperla carnea TaxID=189513 RepID=UPI001D07E566|nr:glucose-6-phosphatase catalytic subunit 1 [Chrysoperla carnea]
MEFHNTLLKSGITAIQSVQTTFANHEESILSASHLGHPDYALSILFPILAAFDTKLAGEVFFSGIVADWINAILKWIFMEDRPYWWVHETDVYGKLTRPEIKQTSVTCETGPGFPSGHLMSTASVLFAITLFSAKKKPRLSYILWTLYLVALIAVSLSRMFVAAHFPHQCVVGAFLGYIVARSLSDCGGYFSKWKQCSRIKMLAITSTMLGITFGVYWAQKGLGFDPQWSVKLAFKWCQKPENIHVSSTPIYSLVRLLGSAYGIAMVSPINIRIRPEGISPTIGIAVTLFCCGVLRYIEQLIPSQSVVQFYVCHFVIAMMYPICLLALIPKVAAVKSKKPKRQ